MQPTNRLLFHFVYSSDMILIVVCAMMGPKHHFPSGYQLLNDSSSTNVMQNFPINVNDFLSHGMN